MQYVSIQTRVLKQLPATLDDIVVGFVGKTTIKYVLKLLIKRGIVTINKNEEYTK